MNPKNHNGSTGVEHAPAASRTTASPAQPEPRQSRLGLWAVVVVIVAVAAAAAGWIPRMIQRRELIKETRELAIPTVDAVKPVPGKAMASLELPADLRPYVEAPIYARASGYIKKWYFDIGAKVEEGQLLADIDAPEISQQLDQAKAELVQAEAALALAKVTADRWAELLKTSSVSDQENAEKQADLKLKQANVDAAGANVRRLADLESFTHVKSPFSGTLTLRDIDTGDLISPGKELFRMADTRKLRVFIRVPQSATPGIKVGVDAAIIVAEKPGQNFQAKVARTAGNIDAASRTLLVELEVDNTAGELLAGSYAQVSFNDLRQDPKRVVPSNTLIFRAQGTQVAVVKADDTVELKDVILGRDYGKTMEVISGVADDDRVIVNPSDSIVSGMKVHLAGETGSEKGK